MILRLLLGIFFLFSSLASLGQTYHYGKIVEINSDKAGVEGVKVTSVSSKWETISNRSGTFRYPASLKLRELQLEKEGWVIFDESVFFKSSESEVTEIEIFNLQSRNNFEAELITAFKDVLHKYASIYISELQRQKISQDSLRKCLENVRNREFYLNFLPHQISGLNWDKLQPNLKQALLSFKDQDLITASQFLKEIDHEFPEENHLKQFLIVTIDWLSFQNPELVWKETWTKLYQPYTKDTATSPKKDLIYQQFTRQCFDLYESPKFGKNINKDSLLNEVRLLREKLESLRGTNNSLLIPQEEQLEITDRELNKSTKKKTSNVLERLIKYRPDNYGYLFYIQELRQLYSIKDYKQLYANSFDVFTHYLGNFEKKGRLNLVNFLDYPSFQNLDSVYLNIGLDELKKYPYFQQSTLASVLLSNESKVRGNFDLAKSDKIIKKLIEYADKIGFFYKLDFPYSGAYNLEPLYFLHAAEYFIRNGDYNEASKYYDSFENLVLEGSIKWVDPFVGFGRSQELDIYTAFRFSQATEKNDLKTFFRVREKLFIFDKYNSIIRSNDVLNNPSDLKTGFSGFEEIKGYKHIISVFREKQNVSNPNNINIQSILYTNFNNDIEQQLNKIRDSLYIDLKKSEKVLFNFKIPREELYGFDGVLLVDKRDLMLAQVYMKRGYWFAAEKIYRYFS